MLWDFAPVTKSLFSFCRIDPRTSFFADKGDNNEMQGCSVLHHEDAPERPKHNAFEVLVEQLKRIAA
jgi:hypothetical protein